MTFLVRHTRHGHGHTAHEHRTFRAAVRAAQFDVRRNCGMAEVRHEDGTVLALVWSRWPLGRTKTLTGFPDRGKPFARRAGWRV